MRILLITDEVWNDRVFGNNVLENWFNDIPEVEFAQICCLPGKPLNRMCTRYFQLTDAMMTKSIFGKRAGISFEMSRQEMDEKPQTSSYISVSPFYSFMKKISCTSVRLLREFIWSVGRYDKEVLQAFVSDFNPDIIFCPRLLTWKLMRLEKIVAKMTKAPFVAFTGDDEASFKEYSLSPLYWGNRFFFHRAFKRHIKIFSHYFTCSEDQSKEYSDEYGVPSSSLYKHGIFSTTYTEKSVNTPIRLIYAGRLYCNRWKSLAEIGNALKVINRDGIKMVLDIYTQDPLSNQQQKALSENSYIFVKGSVTPSELKDLYRNADIALHVESFDKVNRLKTRVSFSTKIIDLMASTCAIMAVCWNEHAGYKYLRDNDAAFCIDSYDKIFPQLQQIVENPNLIEEYAQKAYCCGVKNHSKEKIQKQILDKFNEVISQSR